MPKYFLIILILGIAGKTSNGKELTTTPPDLIIAKEKFIETSFLHRRELAGRLLKQTEKNLEKKVEFDPLDFQPRLFHLRISSKEKIQLDFLEAQITGAKVESSPMKGQLGLADSMHWWSFAWPVRINDARPLLDIELSFKRFPNLSPVGAGLQLEKIRRDFILTQPKGEAPFYLDIQIIKQDPFSHKYDLEINQIEFEEDKSNAKP